MDSKERHELQENDLQAMLTGARDIWHSPWVVKYGNTVLLVILLILAAFAVKMWADSRSARMHEQLWADLSAANTPESFDNIARSTGDPQIQAIALLRAGDLYIARALHGNQPAATPAATDAPTPAPSANPEADAKNAVLFYEEVIGKAGVQKIVRLNALLGLATAHENLRQWDQAAAAYKQLQEEAGDAHQPLALRAKNRLAILPRLSEPVKFAADAPVELPAGNQPGLPLSTGGSSTPAPLPGLGTVPYTPRPVAPAAAPSDDEAGVTSESTAAGQ